MTQTPTASFTDYSSNIYTKIRNDTYFLLVALLMVSWGFFDLTSTYIAIIAHGSIAYEANPLVRAVLSIHPSLFVPYKTTAMLLVLGLCLKGRHHITAINRWDLFFKTLIIGGFLVSSLNMYAAYLAASV